VELIEIPTLREINDNIVAYWRPEAPLSAGESRIYRYRLTAFGGEQADRLGRVQRTRVGWAGSGSDEEPPRTQRRFLVDFRGGDLDGLAPEQPVRAELTSSSGETRELHVTAVPESGVWRASFHLVPGSGAADLRLRLLLRGEPVTETWNYVWYPEERP
jgi:glucans biosynthesis protein